MSRNIVAFTGLAVCAVASPSSAVMEALSNVKEARGSIYDLKDSTGVQMASLHLIDHLDYTRAEDYVGVYMTIPAGAGSTWE
eukprot:gene3120-3658_t